MLNYSLNLLSESEFSMQNNNVNLNTNPQIAANRKPL